MLRIQESKNSGKAKTYYTNIKADEGYYTQSQEMAGKWGGKGAARLGLSGLVTKEAFHLLCDNLDPETGEPLTPRLKANRRVGYDLNFNAPKSVSLAYEWSQDERILKAFIRAERETMEEIERDAATRVRGGGRDENRKTCNLLWGEFVHFTARPDNGIPDPHLHSHCFVFNATYDETEGRWKAAQFGDIKEDAPYHQAAFHARFSKYLRELGYEIELHGKSFEIAGISRSLIEKFSNRTKTIKAEAKRRGVTSAAEMDKLAALTRENKIKDLSKTELHEIWWQRLTHEEKEALEGLRKGLSRDPAMALMQGERLADFLGRSSVALDMAKTPNPKTDRESVAFALEHVFERSSVISERDLIAEALQWGYGEATVDGVKKEVKEFPLIRVEKEGRILITTAEVLAEEKRIVERCQKSKGLFPPLNPFWQIQDKDLNSQQRDAVMSVLSSRDFITGISGKAGTGKTTLLHEAKKGIEAGGQKLFVFAPTAEAARGVLRQQGFENAETVALLLTSPSLQEQARGAVWWVDEAGLMSSRSMDKLLELAEKMGARLVLVGDIGQHHSVERGQAFDLLQKFGKLEVASVDKIQRQKGDYKKAVEQITEQNFEGAFSTFEKMGSFQEIENFADRHNALATDYVTLVGGKKTALVASPTHAECEEVTLAIRQALKEKNVIKEGKQWQTLRNLSWTTAEKRDARHYESGQIVQITKPVKEFAKGEQLEVVELKHGVVRVRCENGDLKNLPVWEPETFNVFKRQSIEVCEGDRIRITANGRSSDNHRLNNGSLYTVDYLDHEGRIVLDNGWRLGKDFAHLDYGYATTSHASQGKTVDWVLVAQSGLLSSSASDAKQFYVSVSRGRQGVKIYTDDIEALRENVAQVKERPMAMEIMAKQEKASERLGEEAAMKCEMPKQPNFPLPLKGMPTAPKPMEKVPLAEHLGKQPAAEIEALQKKVAEVLNAKESVIAPMPKKAPVIAPPITEEKEPEIEPEQMEMGM